MKNQRARLFALIAMVLVCTMVLPLFGGCGTAEETDTKKEKAAAQEVQQPEGESYGSSKTPVATKSNPNAESLQSTPNKGGNKQVTSGTTSVKSKYSEELEALANLDVNAANTVEARRAYAEAYMRAMLTVEWTLEERPETQIGTTDGKTFYLHDYADMAAVEKAADGKTVLASDSYQYKVGKYTFPLKSGRTYRGLPYSNGDSGLESFNLLVKSTENGVATMDTRFDVVYLYGGEAIGRIGNTEATALIYAWNTVSYSSRATSTAYMVPQNGYYFVEGVKLPEMTEEEREAAASKLPIPDPNGVMVGAGVADKRYALIDDGGITGDTDEIVAFNGEQGIYAAYANAKKADGMIRNDGTIDAKMVVSVNVVTNPDGTINGDESYAILMGQTHILCAEEVTDENGVYLIGDVDRKMTFKELFEGNYVPMTVIELIDGNYDNGEAMIRDQYEYDKRRTGSYIYSGVINGSRRIIWVTTEIRDENGNLLFSNLAFAERGDIKNPTVSGGAATSDSGRYTFDLGKLDDSHEKIVSLGDDVIANSALGKGTFHYKVTARMISGEEIVVRDFSYTNS